MKLCSARSKKAWAALVRSAVLLLCCVGLLTPAAQAAELSPAPAHAKAYLIEPENGATVSSPVAVKFGLVGMGVAPAGIDRPNTGHHHLLVDLEELPNLTEPLAATDHIKHFGGGQTETEIALAPGEHTLQLLLGNYTHIPHDKPVLSEAVTIQVSQ